MCGFLLPGTIFAWRSPIAKRRAKPADFWAFNTVGKRVSPLRFPSRLVEAPCWLALGKWRGPGRAAGDAPRGTFPICAAPVEDRSPSPVQPCFRISTTPTTRGRKSSSPGSIAPRMVWKSHSHGPIADWLGRLESAQPGEDRDPTPFQKSLRFATTPSPWGQKGGSPGSTPPLTVWKPKSHRPVADWLERVDPAPPGEDRAPCPDRKSLRISTTPTPGGRNDVLPGQHRLARCGNPNAADRSIFGWGSDIDPAHPGEDRAPLPVRNSYHASTSMTIGG